MNTISPNAAQVGLESLLNSLVAPPGPPESSAEPASLAGDDQSTVTDNESTAVTPPATRSRKGKKADSKPAPATGEKKPAATAKPPSKGKKKPVAASAPVPETKPEEQPPAGDAAPEEPPVEAAAQPEVQTAKTDPEPPKPATEKRIFWGRNKIGRLEHKLGKEIGNFLVYNTDDVELEGQELADKIAANKVAFRKLAVKVQSRATGIIEFLGGKSSGRINGIAQHALTLLSRERKLVTGDEGNFMRRLLQAGYKKDAARAMSNSTLGALKALEIVVAGEKSVWVPNDKSVFLALLTDKLSLSFMDVEEAIREEDAAEQLAFEERKKASKATLVAATPSTPAPEPEKPTEPVDAGEPQSQGDTALAALIDGIVDTESGRQPEQLEAEPQLF